MVGFTPRLNPRGKMFSGTYHVEGWIYPTAGLEAVVYPFIAPCRE